MKNNLAKSTILLLRRRSVAVVRQAHQPQIDKLTDHLSTPNELSLTTPAGLSLSKHYLKQSPLLDKWRFLHPRELLRNWSYRKVFFYYFVILRRCFLAPKNLSCWTIQERIFASLRLTLILSWYISSDNYYLPVSFTFDFVNSIPPGRNNDKISFME